MLVAKTNLEDTWITVPRSPAKKIYNALWSSATTQHIMMKHCRKAKSLQVEGIRPPYETDAMTNVRWQVAPRCPLRPLGATVTYPMKLRTQDHTARTPGGRCFENVRTNKYMKLLGETPCGKHQHLTNTKYSPARDWFIKTRDEGYFVIKPKKVYWCPK
jgi:hypothetical protein